MQADSAALVIKQGDHGVLEVLAVWRCHGEQFHVLADLEGSWTGGLCPGEQNYTLLITRRMKCRHVPSRRLRPNKQFHRRIGAVHHFELFCLFDVCVMMSEFH